MARDAQLDLSAFRIEARRTRNGLRRRCCQAAGRRTERLAHAGRLLLEYNDSTRAIHRALTATSTALSDEACQIAVSYGGVAVSLVEEAPALCQRTYSPVHTFEAGRRSLGRCGSAT